MRVTGGQFRGRILHVQKGKDIRPTSDKVRQAIFNSLLQYQLPEGAQVLDLFAGSGALGLEALSRGAQFCTFIDKDRSSIKCCERNIDTLDLKNQSKVINTDSTSLKEKALNYIPADLAFFDPPYRQDLVLPSLMSAIKHSWLKAGAICVIEAEENTDVFVPEVVSLLKRKKYGSSQVLFCRYGTGIASSEPL